MKNKVYLMVIAIITVAMNSFAQTADKDGNTYTTVTIGTQLWLAENLNVTRFRNGDTIPEAGTSAEWEKAGTQRKPAWCYYDNDPKNGKKYGKLYNWWAVNDPRGLAPEGWHIPKIEEWTKLCNFLGKKYKYDFNKVMKATSGWNDDGNGTNKSGFAGLPGGYRNFFGGTSNGIGYYGYWWSSSDSGGYYAFSHTLTYTQTNILGGSQSWACGLSVRCIRDDTNLII